jgi:hypothetical protein
MVLAFADRTAKWVPFVTVAAIVAVTWGGIVWENLEFGFANAFALWLAVALLVCVFLQGWAYWTDQVETLSLDGGRAEARLMRWVGWGKRVYFTAPETSEWTVVPKSSEPTKLAFINFRVGKQKLSLSLLSPQTVDWDALSTLAPEFFAQVRADYPAVIAPAA